MVMQLILIMTNLSGQEQTNDNKRLRLVWINFISVVLFSPLITAQIFTALCCFFLVCFGCWLWYIYWELSQNTPDNMLTRKKANRAGDWDVNSSLYFLPDQQTVELSPLGLFLLPQTGWCLCACLGASLTVLIQADGFFLLFFFNRCLFHPRHNISLIPKQSIYPDFIPDWDCLTPKAWCLLITCLIFILTRLVQLNAISGNAWEIVSYPCGRGCTTQERLSTQSLWLRRL